MKMGMQANSLAEAAAKMAAEITALPEEFLRDHPELEWDGQVIPSAQQEANSLPQDQVDPVASNPEAAPPTIDG